LYLPISEALEEVLHKLRVQDPITINDRDDRANNYLHWGQVQSRSNIKIPPLGIYHKPTSSLYTCVSPTSRTLIV